MLKALGFLCIAAAIWLAVEGYTGNLPTWLGGSTAETADAPRETTLQRAESSVQRSVAESEARTKRLLGE